MDVAVRVDSHGAESLLRTGNSIDVRTMPKNGSGWPIRTTGGRIERWQWKGQQKTDLFGLLLLIAFVALLTSSLVVWRLSTDRILLSTVLWSATLLVFLSAVFRILVGRFEIRASGYVLRVDLMDSVVVVVLGTLLSLLWTLDTWVGSDGRINAIIAMASILTVLAAVVGYFGPNYVRAFLNFRVGSETVEARLIHVHKEQIDIRDRDFEASKGIVAFELNDWGSREGALDPPERDDQTGGSRICGPRDPDGNGDGSECGGLARDSESGSVLLPSGGLELFLIAIKYDGKVTFRPMYWWVHFWPPEMFRILRRVDTMTESLPDPDERVLQDTDALVIRDGWRRTYDNLAYQPTEDKVSFPLRRGSVRQDLDHYTSRHNIFLPIWVELPKADDGLPHWLNGDSLNRYALRVVVDPPNLPVRVSKWLELELVDEECARMWIQHQV